MPAGTTALNISGTELRRRLAEGPRSPEWFTFPDVADELRRTHPPRQRAGLHRVLHRPLRRGQVHHRQRPASSKFLELGGRPVTLLDGDIVRKHLSSELGFSKAHRDLNIMRIGFVASEITKNGGIAALRPHRALRRRAQGRARAWSSPTAGSCWCTCPRRSRCASERDRKGMYAKARAGILKEFTGISDPYEAAGGRRGRDRHQRTSPRRRRRDAVFATSRRKASSPGRCRPARRAGPRLADDCPPSSRRIGAALERCRGGPARTSAAGECGRGRSRAGAGPVTEADRAVDARAARPAAPGRRGLALRGEQGRPEPAGPAPGLGRGPPRRHQGVRGGRAGVVRLHRPRRGRPRRGGRRRQPRHRRGVPGRRRRRRHRTTAGPRASASAPGARGRGRAGQPQRGRAGATGSATAGAPSR